VKIIDTHPTWIVLSAALICSACALTSRSEPMQVRYFSAELSAPETAQAPRQSFPNASGLELRLDRVRSSAHLGDAIAYRSAEHEVGYYEGERWTERPEEFLERALERALFQDHGIKRVIAGASETLVVELTSFEEIRGPTPVARFEATITLHDERTSQLVQTLRIERPIPASGKDAATRAVAALSDALQEAVGKIAQTITQQLSRLAAADPANAPPAAASAEEPRRDHLH
jgi:ABC-type uncharacterized transport system auxiliary subunit